ncbi:hypothetical protein WOLCODRAFT_144345 [Wolfiporia cocos MD-104 SS10]|uniref:C2H2-type domain-containing protein n=1 Tax=Wolfiporia cocos (strain MD-104) TaxID=742152 RepID=A0A2H3JLG4_WOLCO|nr:hypothetical protein WOLCODRAFT_144345 [Wolfiporia cocos MD-104 SS10]
MDKRQTAVAIATPESCKANNANTEWCHKYTAGYYGRLSCSPQRPILPRPRAMELLTWSSYYLLGARSTTDVQEVLCVAPLDTIKTNNFDAALPLPSISGGSSDGQSTCYPLDAPSGSNVPNTDLVVQYHDVAAAPQNRFNGALDSHSFEAPQGSLWQGPPSSPPVASTNSPDWSSTHTEYSSPKLTEAPLLRSIQYPVQSLHDTSSSKTNKNSGKLKTRKRGKSQKGQENCRHKNTDPSVTTRKRTTHSVPVGTANNDSPRDPIICPFATADCAAVAHPTVVDIENVASHLRSFHRQSYDGVCPLCARPVQLGSLKKHLQSGQHWGTGRRSCTYPGCSASYSRSDRLHKHKVEMGH